MTDEDFADDFCFEKKLYDDLKPIGEKIYIETSQFHEHTILLAKPTKALSLFRLFDNFSCFFFIFLFRCYNNSLLLWLLWWKTESRCYSSRMGRQNNRANAQQATIPPENCFTAHTCYGNANWFNLIYLFILRILISMILFFYSLTN